MPNKKTTGPLRTSVGEALRSNAVIILFVALSLFGLLTSGSPLSHTMVEVFTRFGRNTFLVLALIVPVLAGMGLNFGIVVGAMAAQVAIFIVVYNDITGMPGMLLCFAIATPLAILLGALVGMLFNKTKGSEMITGLVLGYFAEGIYQFVFLFAIGMIIPVNPGSPFIIDRGYGVKNTIDLTGRLKYTIDNITMKQAIIFLAAVYVVVTLFTLLFKKIKGLKTDIKKSLIGMGIAAVAVGITFVPFIDAFTSADRLILLDAVTIGCAAAVVYVVGRFVFSKFIKKEQPPYKKLIALVIVAGAVYALSYWRPVEAGMMAVRLPVFSYVLIATICAFNKWLFSTKLGQDMRTVGQDRQVANSAGINVNRTRVIAMCISTVLAAWGQLIFLQNMGTFSTYGAHVMVGQYAIASLLVGGASVQRAENKNAILGVILFHTLFVVAPLSAGNLFGNAGIGEYFRVFVCYMVIAVALAMHAWKTHISAKPAVDSKQLAQRATEKSRA